MNDHAGEGWDNAADEYDRLIGAAPEEARTRRPDPIQGTRPPALLSFFAGLGIEPETVERMGICGIARGSQGAIVFPWCQPGEDGPLHVTYRVAGKMEAEERTAACLYRDPHQGMAGASVVFCASEIDVLAWLQAEAGVPVYGEPDRLAAAVAAHTDEIAGAERIYLSPDLPADMGPELARRLGRHRCYTIQPWAAPGGGAAGALKAGGSGALATALAEAVPFPLEGIMTVRPGLLREARARRAPPTMTTGVAALDDILRIPTEGRLIVMTGIPGHGKSSLLTHMAVHQMRTYSRRWAIYSPEMSPWDEYVVHCAQVLTRKSLRFTSRSSAQVMSDEEMDAAERWLRSRIVLLENDAEKEAPTLEWALDKFRWAVSRYGVTDCAIDPWTELARAGAEDGATQADQLQRALQKLTGFANRHGTNMWVVAHPTKLVAPKPGAKIPPPTAYDIAGGAQWNNKASVLLTVHREGDETEVYTRKLRFRRFGKMNAMARLAFDQHLGIYSSADAKTAQSRFDDLP